MKKIQTFLIFLTLQFMIGAPTLLYSDGMTDLAGDQFGEYIGQQIREKKEKEKRDKEEREKR